MKIISKLFKYLLITIIVLVLFSPLWISKIPVRYLSFFIGKTPVLDQYLCQYSLKVGSDSMMPFLSPGSLVNLNKCFEESDLLEGNIVLFNKNSELHLAVIRHILPLDPVIYKVSNERPNERLQDIILDEIIAINQDIDTSSSNYQSNQEIDSFILDPEECVSALYLGKIPKGYGVEMAEVEKTTSFSKSTDKFCMVVFPKKELAFVEIEIIDNQSKKIIISDKGIVFSPSDKENINCQDFGSEPGMLNLNSGNYRYRFLLNHQALADIDFTVK